MKRGAAVICVLSAAIALAGCAGAPGSTVPPSPSASAPTGPSGTTRASEAPTALNVVPNVVGLTGDVAYATITAAGFGVVWSVADSTDWLEADVLIDAQEPHAGALVERSSRVTLFGTVQGRGDFIPDEPPDEGRGDYIPDEPPDEGRGDYIPDEPPDEGRGDYIPDDSDEGRGDFID